jgi:RND family efflux transporter MFP subunit
MSRSRLALAALAAVLVVVTAGVLWSHVTTTDAAVVAAAPGALTMRVVGPGTVQARVPVTLGARVGATVDRVHVDVGDVVRKGQLLVTLDDRDLSARRGVVSGQQESLRRGIEAARAALVKAQAELDLARSRQRRDAELLAQGFVSRAVVDASNAALDGALAGVDAARATLSARDADLRTLAQEARYADVVLSHARIVAPMDGIVVLRLGEAGTTVVPGTALLKLVDPQSLWVATRVDESVVGHVQPGQAAIIRLRSGETLPGKVARIARQSDAATRELDVHVVFDTPPQRFAIDQEAEVTIDVGEDRGVLVPLTALARDGKGRAIVFVVDAGRTHSRAVVTGSADAHRVLIRQGLSDGEVVIAVAEGVQANQRVRVDAAVH